MICTKIEINGWIMFFYPIIHIIFIDYKKSKIRRGFIYKRLRNDSSFNFPSYPINKKWLS